MTNLPLPRITKIISALVSMIAVFVAGAIPAWATDEIATNEVKATETGTPWFYWPGWAFLGLFFLVAAVSGFAWYKTIFVPKYRGQKVAQ